MTAYVLETVSTVTAKGQTTVPKPVRDALHLREGDRIAFRIDDSGGVALSRVEEEEADPVADAFLTFLARDMAARPVALAALTPSLRDRLAALVEGVEFDLDQALDGETAI